MWPRLKTLEHDIGAGARFEFGKNWKLFLKTLDDERISMAKASLLKSLGKKSIKGKTFLDVGSGSGLSSLIAKMLGAKVHSFDYDPQSVACTEELKQRFFQNDTNWVVEQGSVLDSEYLASLGMFDVVYAWGVLHHTGSMWQALENVVALVKPQGILNIAIYNDQGRASSKWKIVKRAYNKLPEPLRWLVLLLVFIRLWAPTILRDLIRLRPFKTWLDYSRTRGMMPWTDVVDWVGGYPFEVAKPDEIFDFYSKHHFQLKKLKTCAGGLGCNEFVFQKEF